MKKTSLALVLLLLPAASFAFLNEPEGFRGMKWGDDFAGVSSVMQLVDRNTTHGGKFEREKVYSKQKDKMDIGGIRLALAHYGFYKEKLVSVTMLVPDPQDGFKLLGRLEKLYGPATRKPKDADRLEGKKTITFTWVGKRTTLHMTKDPSGGWVYWLYSTVGDRQRNEDSFGFAAPAK